MTTNATNAPIAPSAASTPQTIDHGDGSRLAAIVPATAVVAQTSHARRGRTGGGTPLAGGSTPTSVLGAAHPGRLVRHAPLPPSERARRRHPIVERHRDLSLDGVDRDPRRATLADPRSTVGARTRRRFGGVHSPAMTFVFDEAMRSYYDRRASEYDDWWLGTGQFAQRDRPGWADEVAQLVAVVAALPPARVLDVACGTGFLSAHLAGEVVALDQSTAMLQIAGERLPGVRVLCGEAVPLPFHDGEFDRVFTSHFYGHLRGDERTDFLAEARRVAPQLVVVDSALREDVQPEEWQERVLDDGSRHRVYKRFFRASDLAEELGGATVLHDGRWFVAVAT